MDRIGFIGLGRMGRPMASNLRRRDFDLIVHDVNGEAMTALAALGAATAVSVAEVAARADRIVLPGDGAFPACRTALGEVDGMAEALREAVTALLIATPRYRTYVTDSASPEDQKLLHAIAEDAAQGLRDRAVLDLLADLGEVRAVGVVLLEVVEVTLRDLRSFHRARGIPCVEAPRRCARSCIARMCTISPSSPAVSPKS